MMFGSIYAKLGLGLAVAILIGLAVFTIKSGINKIAKQGAQIEALRRDLAAEVEGRKRDVQGLTVLTQGMVGASSARALDEEALRESIDAKNPQPVSPDLGRFLDRLRAGTPEAPAASTAPAGARPAPAGRARAPAR
jgi:hypothetical protein